MFIVFQTPMKEVGLLILSGMGFLTSIGTSPLTLHAYTRTHDRSHFALQAFARR